MKKVFLTLLILTTLLLSTITAEETTETQSPSTSQLSALKGGLNEKTENILEKEIQLPTQLEFLSSIINGISNTNPITWKDLIIYIALIIFLFVSFIVILEFTALETNWVKITIALSVTIITSTLGIINKIINTFYVLTENFWTIIGILAILITSTLFIKSLLEAKKRQERISKARELGIKSGVALRGLKRMGEIAISTIKNQ